VLWVAFLPVLPLMSAQMDTPVPMVMDDATVASSHTSRPAILLGLNPLAVGRSSLGFIAHIEDSLSLEW
jgi:hypothetical protein